MFMDIHAITWALKSRREKVLNLIAYSKSACVYANV